MGNREIIVHQIDNILKNISFNSVNITDPEITGWEKFIAQHPEYVQHEYGTALRLVELGVPALEKMPLHKQRIAGTIIRSYFSDEQIEEYGRQEVRT